MSTSRPRQSGPSTPSPSRNAGRPPTRPDAVADDRAGAVMCRAMTVDREQLRRDLSDALSAVQTDHDVTGLEILALRLFALEEPYAFHGQVSGAPWSRCR